jgi:hypothetical protein
MNLTFNEATHKYFIDGQSVPSVTQILNDVLPYQFTVDDWYLERGQVIHACAVLVGKGQKFEHDDRIAGHVKALYKFWKEVKPSPMMFETKVASLKYRFAGTFDLLAVFNSKLCLFDYKSSLDIERTALQLAGYALAREECQKTQKQFKYGIGVEIKENGKYKMSKIINLTNYKREFLALRAVYAIRERMAYHKEETNE